MKLDMISVKSVEPTFKDRITNLKGSEAILFVEEDEIYILVRAESGDYIILGDNYAASFTIAEIYKELRDTQMDFMAAVPRNSIKISNK